jgi:D-alanyl-D-alanine carboxypeptidase
MRSYSSETHLGPHNFLEPEKESGVISRLVEKTKDEAMRPHRVSSALIMIALLSFGANFSFAYQSFVRQGLEPELYVKSGLGSDDGSMVGQPPRFVPSTHYQAIENPPPLNLSAESYLIADAETGEIIFEKEADTQHPMASVTKFMTAIIAREHIDSHHEITISKESLNSYGTEGGLVAGEKILVSDLYYPLLIESSNDAAEVLADDFGRESFLDLLNERAADLTMYSTMYKDPSGLSPDNLTSAHDLTKLGLYVFSAYPELLDVTRVKQYGILGHTWINSNLFLTYPNFLGGKNGFINESKKTTLSFFRVNFRGSDPLSKAVDRPLVLVLLKSNDRDSDAALLLSYVTRNIRYVDQAPE